MLRLKVTAPILQPLDPENISLDHLVWSDKLEQQPRTGAPRGLRSPRPETCSPARSSCEESIEGKASPRCRLLARPPPLPPPVDPLRARFAARRAELSRGRESPKILKAPKPCEDSGRHSEPLPMPRSGLRKASPASGPFADRSASSTRDVSPGDESLRLSNGTASEAASPRVSFDADTGHLQVPQVLSPARRRSLQREKFASGEAARRKDLQRDKFASNDSDSSRPTYRTSITCPLDLSLLRDDAPESTQASQSQLAGSPSFSNPVRSFSRAGSSNMEGLSGSPRFSQPGRSFSRAGSSNFDVSGGRPHTIQGLPSPAEMRQMARKSRTLHFEPLVSAQIVATREKAAALKKVKEECNSFENCVGLAKKHAMPLPLIRQIMEEFSMCEIDSDKCMSIEEFQRLVRRKCHLGPEEPIPSHMQHCRFEAVKEEEVEPTTTLSMDDFVFFYKIHALDKFAIGDNQDTGLRDLAREHKVSLLELESMEAMVHSSLQEGKDALCEVGFRTAFAALTGRPPTPLQWTEANVRKATSMTLLEFLNWYLRQNRPQA